jgi:hypothetical protein
MKKWVKLRPNISLIEIDYLDVIENPVEECIKVNNFLGNKLEVEKMAAKPKPELYRNRQLNTSNK